MKIQRRPSNVLLPVPLVMVSVAGVDGGDPDIVTLAWVGNVCSAPPMLSISLRPSRHSYGLLQRTHEFVVNVPTRSQAREVDLCGNVSGRDTDKFAATGLTAVRSDLVDAPYVQEFPLVLECRVVQIHELGLHTQFVGQILDVKFNEDVLDSRGRLQAGKVDPLSYVIGEYWSLGEKVGSYGYTLKEPQGGAKG